MGEEQIQWISNLGDLRWPKSKMAAKKLKICFQLDDVQTQNITTVITQLLTCLEYQFIQCLHTVYKEPIIDDLVLMNTVYMRWDISKFKMAAEIDISVLYTVIQCYIQLYTVISKIIHTKLNIFGYIQYSISDFDGILYQNNKRWHPNSKWLPTDIKLGIPNMKTIIIMHF